MSSSLADKIKSITSDICVREGCLLYDLEFLEGGSRILRIYIDRDPNGASLEDCVNVSRALNLALDVEDVIPGGKYDLEVSTPGLERKLSDKWHFEKAVGKNVQIKFEAEDMNKTVKGKILEVSEDQVLVEEGSKTHSIPFHRILKAKTVFGESNGAAPKKGPGNKKGPGKKAPSKKR